ncbi:hypothetical protein COT87_00865 [Candidatus Collierbacteria bacterium CG10_big_fil_rev_8_21_14_0_10_44_9]|uniref:Thymidylate synthase/dCMP hydroxymethylase domain-containing protein n=1 Tax=Candidatus Collierbacteria bacterium CG10_big_fil_rev_8_21_14_0_10_44_9 TaxID=1974535 RepID=A0A2H0VJ99_9BACT|nr:MAG: hypothetical protein COT87_00865 [Candidatus Collierbacteria bacterium CG10_big_fil_rev_8_21_14_0_10_44_9]
MIIVKSTNLKRAFNALVEEIMHDEHGSADSEMWREAVLSMEVAGGDHADYGIDYDGVHFKVRDDFRSENSLFLDELVEHYENLLVNGERVAWVIDYLQQNSFSKRAIINFWKAKHTDLSKKCPCVVYFLFRKSLSGLNMSVHMRSNDVNRKTLLNLIMFNAVHRYIATQLNESVGTYYHFVDTAVVLEQDKEKLLALHQAIQHEYHN